MLLIVLMVMNLVIVVILEGYTRMGRFDLKTRSSIFASVPGGSTTRAISWS